MANQQKGVQQDTAYMAVVVNDHMYDRCHQIRIAPCTLTHQLFVSHTTLRHALQCYAYVQDENKFVVVQKCTWLS